MAEPPFDLITLPGIVACVTESLLPALGSTFNRAGNFGMAVVSIATRFAGQPLPTPRTVAVLSIDPASEFLPRAYRQALREYHATGALTVGLTTSAMQSEQVSDPFEAMVAILEHKTFGVHGWYAPVLEQGGKRVLGPFEADGIKRPDQGFLHFARLMLS